ncbi:MAG: NAD(P)-dependent oxidoreductase [Anaerotignum sp.]
MHRNGDSRIQYPGANANAVKELVLAGLLVSSRRIINGAQWVQTLAGNENVEKAVEAGKKQFIGPEIVGKTLGVIGLGAIGVLVANAALDLGMDVIGYDPFLTLEAAWHLSASVDKAETLEELVSKSDYITIHIPLNDKTGNTFDEKLFAVTKKGARLLNFARGGLVNNDALKDAIEKGIIARYSQTSPTKPCWATKTSSFCPIWARPHQNPRKTAPKWLLWNSENTCVTATSAIP